jgi:2-polyprenyl-6-methoxyphenol hydroxylase-like FAD-dependent oxidoreductase
LFTDKVNVYSSKKPKSELVLFSPRSLQLLHHLDLLSAITQKGIKHWKFDLYQNKGYGSQSVNVDQQSIRLWENDTTQFNYSVSCEKSVVHGIFKEYLEREEGIQVVYKQEVINIEENQYPNNQDAPKHDIIPSSPTSTAEISLYYQHRPLPIPNSHIEHDFRTKKTIHLRNTDTGKIMVWKSQAIVAADGQSSFVRQKLGNTHTNVILSLLHCIIPFLFNA